MKKLITTAVLALSFGILVPVTKANAVADKAISPASGEMAMQRWGQRRWGRRSTYVTTRIVRIGFRRYRETIRVTRWPNGRTQSRVISRVRIR